MGWNRIPPADTLKGMIRKVYRSVRVLAAVAFAAAAACDRSPTGDVDVDLEALEALAGPTDAGRSVVSDFIAIATRLQAGDGGVPDIALPTLGHLFDRAVEAESETRGREFALELRARHLVLLDSAWSIIEKGDGGDGEQMLSDARAFQASTAARLLGRPASMAYVFLVGRTLERVNRELIALDRLGHDVRRLRRMAASARDLQADARSALGRGEAASALDVGAHAADLVNNLVREVRAR